MLLNERFNILSPMMIKDLNFELCYLENINLILLIISLNVFKNVMRIAIISEVKKSMPKYLIYKIIPTCFPN